MSLYADDTKIWRRIVSDILRLQKDIEYLHDWSLSNKMRFHPDKCKVLSVIGKIPEALSLLSVLPFYNFVYSMGPREILSELPRQCGVGDANWKCDLVPTRTIKIGTR